jgi:hypothetical protein
MLFETSVTLVKLTVYSSDSPQRDIREVNMKS